MNFFVLLCLLAHLLCALCNYDQELREGIEQKDMPKFLNALHNGASVNYRYDDGKTPLVVTVEHNNPNLIGYLYGAGVDIEHHEYEGLPILHWAAKQGKPDAVVEMIEYGTYDHLDKQGKLALHHAAAGATNNYLETVILLVENGSDIKAETADGKTAVQLAIHQPIKDWLTHRLANADEHLEWQTSDLPTWEEMAKYEEGEM